MAHEKFLEMMQTMADVGKRVEEGEYVTYADLIRAMLEHLPPDDPERIRLEDKLDKAIKEEGEC